MPPGESVTLDVSARDPEVVLVLDDFFKIVTWCRGVRGMRADLF